MIEKEITFTLNVKKQDFMTLIASPLNLPQFWMFLKDIRIINETEYIAKFKVFMNFNFKMKRVILPNQIIHEGIMDFPKAFFRFTVTLLEGRKELVVNVKGEYQGPFEFLAKSPMKSFLENFRDKVITYYEKRQQAFTVQELFKKLSEDSKDKIIMATIEFNSKPYDLVFKKGKLERVEGEDYNTFLTQILTYTGFIKLLKEEEIYEEEFNSLDELLEKLKSESENKEIVAIVEIKDKKYTVIVKNGRVIYSEIDPKYIGKIRLVEVNEK
ncbi:hypothetical protein SJAV_05190 [Sulfurisphaera javensis]|uniref:Uncharacterized protein n=1 Tax=Sulfurisphaera javensis TaxID=2049879 RepID=A0AAT9GNT5_9CREN